MLFVQLVLAVLHLKTLNQYITTLMNNKTMKKILYILTSLILLLPNLSFGQLETFCSQPSIVTTQTSYPVGSNLTLSVFRFVSEGSTDGLNLLYYNFIYPNGDTTSLEDFAGDFGVEENTFSVRNNLTLADSGWYYVRFRQSGCPTTLDSIHITVTSGLSVPFYESFEEMEHNGNYPNWEFKGVYRPSDSSVLAGKNIKSLWNSLRYYLDGGLPYNAVYHSPDTSIYSYPDSIISNVFSIPDTSSNDRKLTLHFNYVHYLADSTDSEYDTLIVKALIGNNQTPVELWKRGGLQLSTSEYLDTTRLRYPTSNKSYDWKRFSFDLSPYDTANTIKVMIILKPFPGINYRVSNSSLTIIDKFAINYMIDTLDPQSPPSITVDSVHNYDRTHTLTVNIPNNHNSSLAFVYAKTSSADILIETIKLDSIIYDSITYNPTRIEYNDTTVTIMRDSTLNGKVIYGVKLLLKNGYIKDGYQNVTVYTDFPYPPVGVPRLDVDSTRNKDRTYKLRVFLPPDHNSDVILFYDGKKLIKNSIFLESQSDTQLVISDIVGGFKMIEYTIRRASNGIHKHTVSIGNTQDGIFSIFDKNRLNLVSTDTLPVLVDTFTTPITDFNPVINNPSPSTGTYTLTIPLPTRHKATQYEVSENGRLIGSGLLNPENRTSTSLKFKNKTAGTYTYSVRVFNKTTQIVKSNINFTSTYVPAPVVDAKACTTSTLTSPNTSKSSFRYSFTLNPNCPTTSYKALFYSGQNVTGVSASNSSLTQTQINRLTWKPEGGGPRNVGFPNGNIKFTNAELTSKVFNRVASPLPVLGNRWYKVEIVCTTCSQTNKKRVAYFYVTN